MKKGLENKSRSMPTPGGFYEKVAIGALAAARQAKREEDVVIVGQGADRIVRPEIRRPNPRIIGSTAFMPERYGKN